ncbi:MAG: hypothetical protein JO340_19190 [Acidobacteriaceae bacterium]|nr:hypothetical protein [Acidobacteriaceae bacterium]
MTQFAAKPLLCALAWTALLAPVARPQDRLTHDVHEYMVAEWSTHPEHCIRALQLYGENTSNADQALKELQSDQPDTVYKRYTIAMKRDSAGFWNLLATASDVTGCGAAKEAIEHLYYVDPESLQSASEAYQAKKLIAGLAYLLAAEPTTPASPDPPARRAYRACFSRDKTALFDKVNETLGTQIPGKQTQ